MECAACPDTFKCAPGKPGYDRRNETDHASDAAQDPPPSQTAPLASADVAAAADAAGDTHLAALLRDGAQAVWVDAASRTKEWIDVPYDRPSEGGSGGLSGIAVDADGTAETLEGIVRQGCESLECMRLRSALLKRVSDASQSSSGGGGVRTDSVVAGEEVECDLLRLTATELRAMGVEERQALLNAQPMVITGLIDGWKSHSTLWRDPYNFLGRYGGALISAKRAGIGHRRAIDAGAEVDESAMWFSDVIQHSSTEHIIVIDEPGMAVSEDELLSLMSKDAEAPELFEHISMSRVLSFGGGHRGVQIMQHGVAWIGLVAGSKLWHVAHPREAEPSKVDCADGGRIDHGLAAKEKVSHCVQLPGDVMHVPANWWHATCNLEPYTIGFGGQVSDSGYNKSEYYTFADERSGDGSGLYANGKTSREEWFRELELKQLEPLPRLRMPEGVASVDSLSQLRPERIVSHSGSTTGAGSSDEAASEPTSAAAPRDAATFYSKEDLARQKADNTYQYTSTEEVQRQAEAMERGDLKCKPMAEQPTGRCDLERVPHGKVTREMALAAKRPFIISNFTDDWPALHKWKFDALVENYGDSVFHLHPNSNETLGKYLGKHPGEYRMGHAVYPHEGCYSDPFRPYSPFVLGVYGDYKVPEWALPMSTLQIGYGTGKGVGVPPENHPSSWFAAVSGAKRWILYPPEVKPPKLMFKQCMPNCEIEEPAMLCDQQDGEMIFVPNDWWHETCGLDDFSIGIGGITYPNCCGDQLKAMYKNRKLEPCEGLGPPGTQESYAIDDIDYCATSTGKCHSLHSFFPDAYASSEKSARIAE